MSTDKPAFTDPTAAARAWLEANPDDPIAAHVRALAASADRYETLARETARAMPGTTIVLATLGGPGIICITTPEREKEQRIATLIAKEADVGFEAGYIAACKDFGAALKAVQRGGR